MTLPLPTLKNLSEWVHPQYLRSLEGARIPETIISPNPFPRAVFPDFFRPEVIDAIAQRAASIQTAPGRLNIGAARRAQVEWGPYADPEVLRFFCSQGFRALLRATLGSTFRLKRQAVPQLAHFHPSSGGFNCHNDRDQPRDAVALLYLTPYYPENGGGCLQIHDHKKEIVSRIQPKKNTLVIFEVSNTSWHSIEDMRGDWVRRNILFDWEKVDERA